MEYVIKKEMYKNERLHKEIIAYCDYCNENLKFYYVGLSKDLITDRVIENMGLDNFVEKYGKALILYECKGCESSKTLLTLQQSNLLNHDNI